MAKEITNIEAPIESEIRFFLNKIREQLTNQNGDKNENNNGCGLSR